MLANESRRPVASLPGRPRQGPQVLLAVLVLALALGAFGALLGPAPASQACPAATRIVLVRHGQTHWNVQGLLQGQADVPLDGTGLAQAQALGQAMAGKGVDAVYSSPLSRARETARAIAAPHGLPVQTRSSLREIGVGVYTGSEPGQIPSATRTAWGTNPEFAMPSGVPEVASLREPSWVQGRSFEGESLKAVLDRSWPDIRDLVRQHCGRSVVVVTHGGVIQIALTQARGVPVTQYRTFRVANASETVLVFEPDGSVAVAPGW